MTEDYKKLLHNLKTKSLKVKLPKYLQIKMQDFNDYYEEKS